MKRILIISIFFFTTCEGCKLTNAKIKTGWWKYGSGFSLGDVLKFDSNNLRNDTIFIYYKPAAVIINKERSIPGDDNEIIIKELSSDQAGVYHQK